MVEYSGKAFVPDVCRYKTTNQLPIVMMEVGDTESVSHASTKANHYLKQDSINAVVIVNIREYRRGDPNSLKLLEVVLLSKEGPPTTVSFTPETCTAPDTCQLCISASHLDGEENCVIDLFPLQKAILEGIGMAKYCRQLQKHSAHVVRHLCCHIFK